MKSHFFKKAAALLAAGCLCISTGFLATRAYAKSKDYDGQVTGNVYVQADAQKLVSTENFFGSYAYNEAAPTAEVYMPGDTIANGSVEVENQNDNTVHLYLYAMPTDASKFGASGFLKNNSSRTTYNQAQLKAASDELVKQVDLEVLYIDTDGLIKTVYLGKMNGVRDRWTQMDNPANPIDLGEYEKGAKGTLIFTLTVPTDITGDKVTTGGQTLSVGYNGTVAMVDWVFIAEQSGDEIIKPVFPPEVSPTTPSTPKPSPRTGDAAIPYAVAAGLCGVSALAMLYVAVVSKKKQEAE